MNTLALAAAVSKDVDGKFWIAVIIIIAFLIIVPKDNGKDD